MNKPKTQQEKIQYAIDKIDNIEPNTQIKLRSYLSELDSNLTGIQYKAEATKFLGINKSYGSNTKNYWVLRGWPDAPQHIKKKRRDLATHSPFSLEHWLEKGYSLEDAEFKRNSIRPIRKEYWITKGLSEDEAIEKAKEVKDRNNKTGAKASSDRPLEVQRQSSKRCIEYWLSYYNGDEEKAEKALKDFQSNFSLDICIQKHGFEKGTEVWRDRQQRWLNSLMLNNNMIDVNRKKNNSYYGWLERGASPKEAYKKVKSRCKRFITNDKDEYCEFLKSDKNLYTNPLILFKKQNLSQLQILDIDDIDKFIEFLKDNNIKNIMQIDEMYKSQFGYYVMNTVKGFLRSSYEISFYQKLVNEGIYDFVLEKTYENSGMRSDFYFPCVDIHVEIAPMYHKNEKYRLKMEKKKELFGCVLLTDDVDSYDDFIRQLKRQIDG